MHCNMQQTHHGAFKKSRCFRVGNEILTRYGQAACVRIIFDHKRRQRPARIPFGSLAIFWMTARTSFGCSDEAIWCSTVRIGNCAILWSTDLSVLGETARTNGKPGPGQLLQRAFAISHWKLRRLSVPVSPIDLRSYGISKVGLESALYQICAGDSSSRPLVLKVKEFPSQLAEHTCTHGKSGLKPSASRRISET